jgi:hypothetical protein
MAAATGTRGPASETEGGARQAATDGEVSARLDALVQDSIVWASQHGLVSGPADCRRGS